MSRPATLREQLEYAERSCLCESYHRYQCWKCQTMAESRQPDVTEAVNRGLATWEGYGAPRLTEAGRGVLAFMRSEDRS